MIKKIIKNTFILFAILVFVIIGFKGVTYYKNEIAFKRTLSYSITNNSSLDLSKLTPFNWEKLYVFGAYTTQNAINNQLGFETDLEGPYSEELQLLVFINDNKVKSSIVISEQETGASFINNQVYTPSNSVFKKQNKVLELIKQ